MRTDLGKPPRLSDPSAYAGLKEEREVDEAVVLMNKKNGLLFLAEPAMAEPTAETVVVEAQRAAIAA